MSDYTPSVSTVASASFGIPTATILSWLISLTGVEMPGPVEAALGVVISSLIGYFFLGGKAVHTEPELLPVPIIPVIKT